MSTQEVHVLVTDGGSKFDLFAQLFQIDLSYLSMRKEFRFSLLPPDARSATEAVPERCIIQGIVAADDTGDTWFVNGEFRFVNSPDWLVRMFSEDGHAHFHGIYNTRTRNGSLLPGKLKYLQPVPRTR